jgi:cytoskeletal protein CcmA (bactofilin family)
VILEIASPTIIAEDSRLQGEMTFSSPVQIYGLIEGNIQQQSHETLLVGNSGWVRGDISTQGIAIIAGRVEGNIHSMTKVELLPGATVRGTVVAPQLVIRPGANLNGEIVMRWAKERPTNVRLVA